jgi:Amt family ammonium transporter
MVRKKNVLATMAHSFACACLVTVLWVIVGYSMAFAPGGPFIGGIKRLILDGMAYMKDAGKLTVHSIAPSIPESVFAMFQLTFAIITPALITGAFVERIKFSAMLIFVGLWSLMVYAPVAYWVWDPSGWLAAKGVLDFAGGTVVHINAVVSGWRLQSSSARASASARNRCRHTTWCSPLSAHRCSGSAGSGSMPVRQALRTGVPVWRCW